MLDAGDADLAAFVHFTSEAARRLFQRRQLRLPLPGANDPNTIVALLRT